MIPPELASVANRIRSQGTTRCPCPQCNRGDNDKALAVTVDDKGIVWICHRCQWTGSDRGESSAPTSTPRPARPAPVPETAIACWKSSSPIEPGTVAAEYLQRRGCVLPPRDGHLRQHAGLRHISGYMGPCLVALMTHAVTGEPLTVHRTWIRDDGTKADVDPPRLYWPKLPTKHGVVRLWPHEDVTLGLGIAEGIETSLALAHAFTPVWACLDAGHMADLPVLNGIEALTIAADHDDAGIKAARACADRWAEAGIEVHVIASSIAGRDVADEVTA